MENKEKMLHSGWYDSCKRKGNMTYETITENGIKTITISGSIEKLDNFELRREFLPQDRYLKIIVDLTNVVFLDSGFVNLIMEVRRLDGEAGSRVSLLNPNQNIAEIFSLLSLDKHVTIINLEEKGGVAI
jgi:anti-anti-sigma regulatory factor